MNEKPLGSSARRQVELVFQGDLLEGGQGIDAEVPAAGLRKRDVGDVPVAVGAEHGLAFYRSNATLGEAQRQRGFLAGSRLPSPDLNCTKKLWVPTLPGEIST